MAFCVFTMSCNHQLPGLQIFSQLSCGHNCHSSYSGEESRTAGSRPAEAACQDLISKNKKGMGCSSAAWCHWIQSPHLKQTTSATPQSTLHLLNNLFLSPFPENLQLAFFFKVFETASLCSSGWSLTHYVAQAHLELSAILLLQPLECQDYRHAPPRLPKFFIIFNVQGVRYFTPS